MNKKIVERIYPNDKRVKPQTVAHHIARYEFASKFEGEVALDVGCGTGYGCEMLRQAGFYMTKGFDESLTAINYAKEHFPKCHFFRRDLVEMNGTLYRPDLVTMFEVIEHIPFNIGKDTIRWISKVLRNKGTFIMSTPRDINGKYNEFHKSEWPYPIIKNELGSVFKNVKIYGQDWDTAKITTEHVPNEDFYIAVCSND